MRFSDGFLVVISAVEGVIDGINRDARLEPFSITCEAAVIKQAATNGFYEYLFKECLYTTGGSPLNMLGEPVPTPFECVTKWMTNQSGPDPIPESGRCRQSFEFIVIIIWSRSQSGDFAGSSPPWDHATEELTITDDFIQQIQGWVRIHYTNNYRGPYEYILGGGQQCSPQVVRELARKNLYSEIMKVARFDGQNPVSEFVNPEMDGGNAFCYDCYHRFFELVDDEVGEYYANADAGEYVEVCADPT
jgi:hypothetical protein